ncbi:uncharacterized protein LOC122266619 [Penaeus japonicus]|uniref:uncharacterized protein LOC122266619 n=1 Tax=Penaeus japonicus TaxID=27405 RepID=UPI001C70C08B|nr:uncharacterized protein LOC122266619 [Penaeus japonicus]
MTSIGEAVAAVLQESGQGFSSYIVPVGIFEVLPGSSDNSSDESELSDAVAEARKLRKLSPCVTILLLSDDPAFLASFAESSLRGRLLVWATRLLVVTRLPLQELRRLLSSHWTFSMMNAMVLNQEEQPDEATFYGSRVNVTALPYTPHWVEEVVVKADGTSSKIYGGTDYFLLSTIAEALNFSIHVLETKSWDEVATRVEERVSFMASVFHNVLPQRLERYDYSYTYEYGSLDFCVAMPGLRPQWQSLYYPLSDLVWASVLVVLVGVFLSLYVMNRLNWDGKSSSTNGFGRVAEAVFGMLMWQSVVMNMARNNGSRVLVMAWMIFVFIIGTVYRGNLTAALTLPKYPPRVETLLQLVNTFESSNCMAIVPQHNQNKNILSSSHK